MLSGEFTPGGAQTEWCSADVLRLIKRHTLAKLRDQIAPLGAETLARFLPEWHGMNNVGGGVGAQADCLRQLEGLPLAWSALVDSILPARVAGFSVEMLDTLCATGRIAWDGVGRLGARDGRIAICARDRLGQAHRDCSDPLPALGEEHLRVLNLLRDRGASFLTDIKNELHAKTPGLTAEDISGIVWDLVWDGQITNDTFAPLRELGGHARPFRRGARQTRLGGGRWSLAHAVDPPDVSDRTQQTSRALALANQLLDRYGIVSREAVQFEKLAGGFGPVYRTLRAMEESGKIRRGFFVEGLSGPQFALASTADRLRAAEPVPTARKPTLSDFVVLDASDPANVYGSLLPWPRSEAENFQPRHSPGALVVLLQGQLICYLNASRRHLITFGAADEDTTTLQSSLLALAQATIRSRRRRMTLQQINGVEDRHVLPCQSPAPARPPND